MNSAVLLRARVRPGRKGSVTGDLANNPASYPDGYADPPWDGTTAGFRDVVLPARTAAIADSFTAHLASHGFADLRFEWQSA